MVEGGGGSETWKRVWKGIKKSAMGKNKQRVAQGPPCSKKTYKTEPRARPRTGHRKD